MGTPSIARFFFGTVIFALALGVAVIAIFSIGAA